MALVKPQASDAEKKAFYDGIEQFLSVEDRSPERRQAMVPEELAVFTLTLPDVMRDNAFDSAQPAGWQFVTANTTDGAIAGHVSERGGPWRLSGVSRGPRILEIVQALQKLPELNELKNNFTYELRILKIPGALFEAFWLKGTGADAFDWFMPVLSVAPELKPMQVYRGEELLRALRPLAEKFLKFEGVV